MLATFVESIRPENATVAHIEKQAPQIHAAMKERATADGLLIQSTPWSGSFKKKTGIRRYRRDGQTVVEGHDVDLPFIVSPKTRDGKEVKTLLDQFARYAEQAYPNNPRTRNRSSVHVEFKNTKLGYDLVPLLAVPGDNTTQILLRSDGERRKTSVQKHIEFITKRNGTSNAQGVPFNDCIRLVKWLRDLRQSERPTARRVPTFLLELLCAHAYDACKVEKTFPETLAKWFDFMGKTAKNRQRVSFTDFVTQSPPSSGVWGVFDPAFSDSNVVGKWKVDQIDELATWFEKLQKATNEVIGADIAGSETMVRDKLVALFGEPMKSMK
jgi:hypothetical protein